MSDVYRDFAHLRDHETPEVDFRIRYEDRRSDVVVLAPHGGGIEPGTAVLAREIASDDLSWYCFEGIRKGGGNRRLHITSTRFDEPIARELTGRARTSVAIHGARERDGEWTMVGGRESRLAEVLKKELAEAGFRLRDCDHRAASHADNICNRTATAAWVQLELSAALRDRLKQDRVLRTRYVSAVRNAIARRRLDGV